MKSSILVVDDEAGQRRPRQPRPQHEGRDMQELISWVAAQPETQLDATGDPRLGMVGVSYGGGIQLTTAALDCRVDAIVPSWAWHSLQTSLDKADTPKIAVGTLTCHGHGSVGLIFGSTCVYAVAALAAAVAMFKWESVLFRT